jgi:hypothetical protein
LNITYSKPNIALQELFKQLQEDIKQIYYRYTGKPISPLLLGLIAQEVVAKSAFLDGFYFEGDIFMAMIRVLNHNKKRSSSF